MGFGWFDEKRPLLPEADIGCDGKGVAMAAPMPLRIASVSGQISSADCRLVWPLGHSISGAYCLKIVATRG